MDKMFYSRLRDMIEASSDGRTAISDFMNPEEQYHSASYLKKDADNSVFAFYGGYPGAERRKLFIYPSYYEDDKAYKEEAQIASVAAVSIHGSGYIKHSHRSFMGAVLALGINRDTIGDIIVRDERDAYVICDVKIAGYLLSDQFHLEYVGRDKVTLERFIIPPDFDSGRSYEPVSDTIASPRLDAVIAALTGLSREKAKITVKTGMVFLNFTENTDCDSYVNNGDIISVRGFGKYKIDDVCTKTRKDRLRLSALKYI